MLTFISIILLVIGAFLLASRLGGRNKGRLITGAIVVALLIGFFWFMDFWGEKLWFDSVGYTERFWNLFLFQAGMVAAGALLSLAIIVGLLLPFPNERKMLRFGATTLAFIIGGVWGFSNWDIVMKFWNGVQTGLADPILGRDTGFYLFTLPFYDALQTLLLTLAFIGLITSIVARYRLVQSGKQLQISEASFVNAKKVERSIYLNAGVVLLLAAADKYIQRFHLLYSDLGVVSGPGWTDVHIILPTLLVMVALTVIAGVLLFFPAGRNALQRSLPWVRTKGENMALRTVGMTGALVLVVWFIGLNLIPGAFQSFRVEPNEISYEKPHIANNIEFTRHGFKLDAIEEREFPAADTFTRSMVAQNESIFNNIRLWDWRALEAVLKQFQEIRLYYEFNDVDIDRYTYDGQYRQVMVSAREMNVDNLPPNSQTFVNQVFKYTHGYGLALSTVTDFTSEGLPNLLVKNIPPETQSPELAVTQPQIYYGELTDSYVVTNSTEQEFDYPKGEENAYISYEGEGGVQLSNAWRKTIYAYKMGDLNLLLSTYPTSESRLMFNRQIEERIRTLAPFLKFDSDPYIVNADGKLYWMIDAYTTSKYYPYSEPFSATERIQYKEGEAQRTMTVQHNRSFDGVNYIRNSVKIVVNAFNGNVDFYTFDEEDAIIQVWNKIFPDLLKPRSEMPEALLSHIRYPTDYLLMQGLVYAKYHMSDPEVFYNQEDLWIRATEKYYGEVRPVEPYYIMWQLPGQSRAEFSLILPFTPKNRQVSIGWIAGLCDPENYGRFLAYNFPKEKRVLGPQQVETKIDQNSFLSGQLSLWDQRGSSVIRGNVLAIPVDNTLIYVEPIYLQAETAAYPELRLVCVMHDDKLSYAETFDEALEGIFGEAPAQPTAVGETAPAGSDQVQAAQEAFDDYINATGQGQLEEAGRALERLRGALEELASQPNAVVRDTTMQ